MKHKINGDPHLETLVMKQVFDSPQLLGRIIVFISAVNVCNVCQLCLKISREELLEPSICAVFVFLACNKIQCNHSVFFFLLCRKGKKTENRIEHKASWFQIYQLLHRMIHVTELLPLISQGKKLEKM